MILKGILICSLLLGINAFALTDEEAEQKILNNCLSYKGRVNQRIINTIVGLGGTHNGGFDIGVCRNSSFSDGAGRVVLEFPIEYYSTDFSDGGKVVPLIFGAIEDYEWAKDVSFSFWWKKKAIHNHLGNIVGYDYKFYFQDYSDRDDSYVGPDRYYYSVRNADTKERVAGIDIND